MDEFGREDEMDAFVKSFAPGHGDEMDAFAQSFGGPGLASIETSDLDKVAKELDPIERFQKDGDVYDMSRYNSSVHYGRYDLDDDEQRKELESIQTEIVMGRGMLQREEWTTVKKGKIIVTLQWVKMVLKSERSAKEKDAPS